MRSSASALTDPGQVRAVVPRNVVTSYKMRRAWNQVIPWNPTSGFFGASPNIQVNFAGSVSEIRLGGVAVYGPTLPNSSEFSALFDQYRINGVTLRLDWNTNSTSIADIAQSPPLVYFAADYDDSGDANVQALLQYPGVRTHSFFTNGYKPVIFSVKPKPLRDIAGTGLLTSYGPDLSSPFIRTAELSTPHYGIKIATQALGSTGASVTGYLMLTAYIDLEFTAPK